MRPDGSRLFDSGVNGKDVLALARQRDEFLSSPKRCGKCSELKPRSDFHKHAAQLDGFRKYCKECVKLYTERQRWRDLSKLYGITRGDYEEMLDGQGGVCGICAQPCSRGALSVDHSHDTVAVRGLLCRDCNQGLGAFKDSPERLTAAIRYLQ